LVFVQLVIAAIKTLPWRISPSHCVDEATAFGVGRLLAISNSVVGLVLRAWAEPTETGSWLPPLEALGPSWAETKKVLPSSSADLPKPFSGTGLANAAANSFLRFGSSM